MKYLLTVSRQDEQTKKKMVDEHLVGIKRKVSYFIVSIQELGWSLELLNRSYLQWWANSRNFSISNILSILFARRIKKKECS